MIGIHSSSRPTMERITRVLAWPRSPRRMMSCPARMAFSSWGTTVSSKPSTPGTRVSPAAISLAVLRRISSATGTDSQPEARRSAIDPGRSAGGARPPGRGSRKGRKGRSRSWSKPKPLAPGDETAAGGGAGRGADAGTCRSSSWSARARAGRARARSPRWARATVRLNVGAVKGMPTREPSPGSAMAGTTAAPSPAATKERTPAISAPSLTRCGSTPASWQAVKVTERRS